MHRWFGAAIAVMALASAAGGASGGCGTVRLGQTTVATLRNAPIVTLLANGMPATMLLDTGAETTVLTPAVAQRIGAVPTNPPGDGTPVRPIVIRRATVSES